MNKNELNELKKTYSYMRKKDIYGYQISIISELEYQLEFELNDDDYLKLFNAIECAYIRVNDVRLVNIVRCAIDNIDSILSDDNKFNLKNASRRYE